MIKLLLVFIFSFLSLQAENMEIKEFRVKELNRKNFFFKWKVDKIDFWKSTCNAINYKTLPDILETKDKDLIRKNKPEKENTIKKGCENLINGNDSKETIKNIIDNCSTLKSYKIEYQEQKNNKKDFFAFVKHSCRWDEKLGVIDSIITTDSLPSEDNLILTISDKENNILLEEEVFFPTGNLPFPSPVISNVYPKGGVYQDIITVKGHNFSKNSDNITVIFLDINKWDDKPYGEFEIDYSPSFYVNSSEEIDKEVGTNFEILKFSIPNDVLRKNLKNSILEQTSFFFFGKKIHFYLNINNRSTNASTITILHPFWKFSNLIYSFIVSAGFWILVGFLMKKLNFVSDILISGKTGTYNLAHFQSFFWTVLLLFSYFYVACAKMLILSEQDLPDFNYNLVALLSISYGGLYFSRKLEKEGKGIIKNNEPKLMDLICNTDGRIDMASLQLLGFTLIGGLIYILNLTIFGNPILGLPDIPPTLLTLLLASQTGYSGMKYAGSGISIFNIEFKNIKVNSKNQKIIIRGNGFSEGIKILLKGFEQLEINKMQPTEIVVNLPILKNAGKYDITIITKEGEEIEIKEAFECIG